MLTEICRISVYVGLGQTQKREQYVKQKLNSRILFFQPQTKVEVWKLKVKFKLPCYDAVNKNESDKSKRKKHVQRLKLFYFQIIWPHQKWDWGTPIQHYNTSFHSLQSPATPFLTLSLASKLKLNMQYYKSRLNCCKWCSVHTHTLRHRKTIKFFEQKSWSNDFSLGTREATELEIQSKVNLFVMGVYSICIYD